MTYTYYREAYHGADVPEALFATWAARAEERLSADTCGRSDGILLAALVVEQAAGGAGNTFTVQKAGAAGAPAAQTRSPWVGTLRGPVPCASIQGEQTRRAVCAVADILYRACEDEKARGPLVSETVGGWSRSYAARDRREVERSIRATEALYLGGTGILYRGR